MQSYYGQIMMLGFNWAPAGYALCNGASLAVNEHQALFSLLGTQFGGNGVTTFNLPDLRSRTPVGSFGSEFPMSGMFAGFEYVTLTASTMPQHTHEVSCYGDAGNSVQIQDGALAAAVSASTQAPEDSYAGATNLVSMNQAALPTAAGGGASHYNLQPSTVINFVIAIDGLYPQRN